MGKFLLEGSGYMRKTVKKEREGEDMGKRGGKNNVCMCDNDNSLLTM